jgi:hypothetical protein
MEVWTKKYLYGYYQALLLDRIMPEWKRDFWKDGTSLADFLGRAIRYDTTQASRRAERLRREYRLPALLEKHGKFIAEGAKVVRAVEERAGRRYVVDFSRIGRFDLIPREAFYPYKDGSTIYCPLGIERIDIGDLSLVTEETPLVIEDSYYIRWIDEEKENRMKLESTLRDETGVYHNAIVETDGFVLRAPRLRVVETRTFTKLTILPEPKR